jgi:hypothetical protein
MFIAPLENYFVAAATKIIRIQHQAQEPNAADRKRVQSNTNAHWRLHGIFVSRAWETAVR